MSRLISQDEVLKTLKISNANLKSLVKRNHLEAYQIATGAWHFRLDEVLKLKDSFWRIDYHGEAEASPLRKFFWENWLYLFCALVAFSLAGYIYFFLL